MNWPKCNAEQAGNAKLCSQCAGLLAEPVLTVAKSKVPTWLSGVLLIALAFIGIAVWNMMQQNERLRANLRKSATANAAEHPQYQPTTHSVPLTNGAATINATSYSWYKFDVPVNAPNVVLDGHFPPSRRPAHAIKLSIFHQYSF